jgi:hypothetical protein
MGRAASAHGKVMENTAPRTAAIIGRVFKSCGDHSL